MTSSPLSQSDLMRKFLVRTTIWLILLGLLLFGAAGTFRWPEAWIYLAWAAVISFGGGYWLARHDSGLLNERLGSLVQRDQKAWDKLFMGMMLVLWFAWYALMGLDVRYHWSHVPVYAQVIGHAQGRARGLCRLCEPRPLPPRALSLVIRAFLSRLASTRAEKRSSRSSFFGLNFRRMTLAGLLAEAARYHAALARHSQGVLRYCRERVEGDV